MDMHLNLSHVPHLAPFGVAQGGSNVSMGTAGLAPDDNLRKLVPLGIGDCG